MGTDEGNCLSSCFQNCYKNHYSTLQNCKHECQTSFCAFPDIGGCFNCKNECLDNLLALLPYRVHYPSPRVTQNSDPSDFEIPDFAKSATVTAEQTPNCNKPEIKLKIASSGYDNMLNQ